MVSSVGTVHSNRINCIYQRMNHFLWQFFFFKFDRFRIKLERVTNWHFIRIKSMWSRCWITEIRFRLICSWNGFDPNRKRKKKSHFRFNLFRFSSSSDLVFSSSFVLFYFIFNIFVFSFKIIHFGWTLDLYISRK